MSCRTFSSRGERSSLLPTCVAVHKRSEASHPLFQCLGICDISARSCRRRNFAKATEVIAKVKVARTICKA